MLTLAATAHTSITGWSVIVALLILLLLVVMEKVLPPSPWVLWGTCFMVALFGLTLTVRW